MNYLSLFSGIGGGDLGLQQLSGWKCVGYVEWDKYCVKVLNQRILDGALDAAPIFHCDIREWLKSDYIKFYSGSIDAIAAGFPCQPFSLAGKGAADGDTRNMWPATLDAIRLLRPKFVFLENVRGLLSKPYFGQILTEISDSGYNCKWRILSAAECGAPHKRDRVWIMAYATEQPGRKPSGQSIAKPTEIRPSSRNEFSECGEHISDATGNRDGGLEQGQSSTKWSGQSGYLYSATRTWKTEPGICRVVDGLPARLVRLEHLGNGQVASVAATAWTLLTG